MVKLGLIGYGYWGPNVARNAHKNKNIDLVVICDKKKDRLEKAKEIFLEQTNYELNADVVINNPDINVSAYVYLQIFTRNVSGYEQEIQDCSEES